MSQLSIGRYSIITDDGKSFPDIIHPSRQFDVLPIRIPDPEEAASFEVASNIALQGFIDSNYAMSNSNLTFYKDLWRRVGGFNETIKTTTDLDFLLKCMTHSTLAVANHVVLHYRFRDNSLNRRNADRSELERRSIVDWFVLRHPRQVERGCYLSIYWRARQSAASALRRGNFISAARIYWRLLFSGSLMHHWRNRQAMRGLGCSD